MSSPAVSFLHVPKTAGTAVLRILERSIPPAQLLRWYPPDLPEPEAELPDRDRVLIGHFAAGEEDRYLRDPLRLTMLRDPVARCASQLRYEKRRHEFPEIRTRAEADAWFRENDDSSRYIAWSRYWLFDNLQVRMLSGVRQTVPFGELTEEHLERALRYAEGLDLIMLQDRFDEDLIRVRSRLGWRTVGSRVNVGSEAGELDAKQLFRIAEHNRLDQELYDRACELRSAKLDSWRSGPGSWLAHHSRSLWRRLRGRDSGAWR